MLEDKIRITQLTECAGGAIAAIYDESKGKYFLAISTELGYNHYQISRQAYHELMK